LFRPATGIEDPDDVACYDPCYTFVEKLQTVSTKFRRQQESGEFPANFMRHYYDIYKLLRLPEVQRFIGTLEYKAHKEKRFRRPTKRILPRTKPSF
jgi:hypothetical protein